MKKPTYEELERELNQVKQKLESVEKQLHKELMVRKLVVAAGLLPEEKFDQARELASFFQ